MSHQLRHLQLSNMQTQQQHLYLPVLLDVFYLMPQHYQISAFLTLLFTARLRRFLRGLATALAAMVSEGMAMELFLQTPILIQRQLLELDRLQQ